MNFNKEAEVKSSNDQYQSQAIKEESKSQSVEAVFHEDDQAPQNSMNNES